jgi:hypothetical protein
MPDKSGLPSINLDQIKDDLIDVMRENQSLRTQLAAATAERDALVVRLDIMAMGLLDPNTVHSCMLRGTVAKLDEPKFRHLLGLPQVDELKSERDRLREGLMEIHRSAKTVEGESKYGARLAHDWVIRECERALSASASGAEVPEKPQTLKEG